MSQQTDTLVTETPTPAPPVVESATPAVVPENAAPHARLQRDLGNAAIARMMIQRKAEDAVSPPSSTPAAPATPATSASPTQAAGPRIVDDRVDSAPGQMHKTEFLTQLRTSVCNAAAEAFRGTRWSEEGCPYIERVFAYCAVLDSERLERGIRRYAPETASVTTAAELIPLITARVQRSLTTWVRTGQVTGVPDDIPVSLLGSGVLGAVGGIASGFAAGVANTLSSVRNIFYKHENGGTSDVADPVAVQSQLHAGRSLDSGVRTQMESAFGRSFGDVQVHTDPTATTLAKDLKARAFTVGNDIAFASGQYQPGTLIGDALIAHELAHVAQQSQGSLQDGVHPQGSGHYGEFEDDADQAAVGAVVSTWGTRAGLPPLTQRTLPMLKSGLRLQRCDEEPQYFYQRRIPAPSQIAPGFGEREAGVHEFPRYEHATRATVFHFDGDGDQQRELIGRLRVLRSGRLEYPTLVEFEIEQISSHTVRSAQFTLSEDVNAGGGNFSPRLEYMTNGHDPTVVQITEWGGPATRARIFPPQRSAQGVSYRCEVAGQTRTYDFPTESTRQFQVFQTEAPQQAGPIWGLDVGIGAYRDRFRLSFSRESATRVIFGMSALSAEGPVGGQRADLNIVGSLNVRVLSGDATSLSLDLNGDGQADLNLYDHLRAQPDYSSSFQHEQPARFRRHSIEASGAALNTHHFFWDIREGQLLTGLNVGTPETFPAASQAAGLGSVSRQANIGLPGVTLPQEAGTMTGELDVLRNILNQARLEAKTAGLISESVFNAWDVLQIDMIVIQAQLERNPPSVDPNLQRQTAQHAAEFYDALSTETSSGTVRTGPSQAGYTERNAYTGYEDWIAHHVRPREELLSAINAGQWAEAFRVHRRLVNGLDRWIEHMYRQRRESLPADTPTNLVRSAGVLSDLQMRVEDVRSHNPTRVAAVFHAEQEYTAAGHISEIPLSLYYWREGNTWHLQDLTSPDAPHETDSVTGNQTEPPASMFIHMAESSHYPRGLIYYRLPSGTTGRLTPTGPGVWREWLTWIGVGLAAVGLGLVTFGTGTVAVVGAVALGASAAIGGGLAAVDLIERAQHGNLSAGQAILDVAQIIAAIAGIGLMRAGRIVAVARSAAAEGLAIEGQAALTVLRAQNLIFPLTATALGADLITLAVLTPQAIQHYQSLDSIDDPNARRRAQILLLGQLALTFGLTALSVRGNVAEITTGRNIIIEYIPGPGGAIPVAIPQGLSTAGRAITRTRGAVTTAADEAATRAAQEAHLQNIRSQIPTPAGRALAEIEDLALQARPEHAATFPMIADRAGNITRARQPVGTLEQLTQQLAQANNAARAHGLDVEYVLRIESGPTPETSTVRIEGRSRGPGTGASTAGLHTNVPVRTQTEFQQLQRLRRFGPGSNVALTSEGQIELNGQVTMHPSRVAEISDADLTDLLRLTRQLQLGGANEAAFNALSRPDRQLLTTLRGRYGFRYTYQRAEVQGVLSRLGIQDRAIFQNLTEAQLSRIEQGIIGETLPNTRQRGAAARPAPGQPPDLQAQAASWAISRNPATAEEFVNLYQFYVARFRGLRTGRIAQRNTRFAQLLQERLQAQPDLAGNAEALQAERSRIENQVNREFGTDAEIGGDILREYGEASDVRVAGARARTEVGTAYEQRFGTWQGRVGAVRLRLGAAEQVRNLSPEEVVRRIQEAADEITFRDASTATYHTEKHYPEILPAGSPATTADGVAYLRSARDTIRADTAVAEIAREGATYTYGGSRSYRFRSRLPNGNLMTAFVAVTDNGEVFLLTYFNR
jgi:uncharacterized protein DUF4157